jgi:hypothetical protein
VPVRHSYYEPRVMCPYWFRLTARVPMSMIDQDMAVQDYDQEDYLDWGDY